MHACSIPPGKRPLGGWDFGMQNQGRGGVRGLERRYPARTTAVLPESRTIMGDRRSWQNREIQAFDDQRRALLDELAALPAESLAVKPGPDRWSILEIVEHLVLSERYVLCGMPAPAELVPR